MSNPKRPHPADHATPSDRRGRALDARSFDDVAEPALPLDGPEALDAAALERHVARVCAALDSPDLAALVHRIRAVRRELGVPSHRVPFAVLGPSDPNGSLGWALHSGMFDVEIRPQLVCRLTHLVLAPSCARLYDLCDVKVGKDSQLAGWGGYMPGECFSLEYAASDDRLSTILQWKTDYCEPGIVLRLSFAPSDEARAAHPDPTWRPPRLRGLLWAECFDGSVGGR